MAALAPFLRALGHRVHERPDIDWVEVGALSLMPMPSMKAVTADDAAIGELLRKTGRVAASFVAADGRGVGTSSWWVRDPTYGLQSVQRQFRQHLRRGEGRTVVRPLTWDAFRAEGLPVHRDVALSRGARETTLPGQSAWDAICTAAEAMAGAEVTGCFVDGTLAGYVLSVTSAGVCEGILAEVSKHRQDAMPAHSLYHGFAATMIRRPGVKGVTIGRQSIPPRASLDAFKRHAGFVAEPVAVAVVLHPTWRILSASPIRRGLHLARRMLHRRLPMLDNVALLDAAANRHGVTGHDAP